MKKLSHKRRSFGAIYTEVAAHRVIGARVGDQLALDIAIFFHNENAQKTLTTREKLAVGAFICNGVVHPELTRGLFPDYFAMGEMRKYVAEIFLLDYLPGRKSSPGKAW